jgi:predicted ATP-grasp superfamily ATP-dependent carboligase
MNILLTGGRAPATLDLARAFHRAGHTVFMAESLRGHLSQPSNAVKANFVVPAPRQDTDAFLAALKRIIEENQIDLLIPTCEEIFHIAKARDDLPCKVFAEPLEKLNRFHNKWNFVMTAVEYDLQIPETILIHKQDDLLHAYAQWRGLVIKPVYSRFAARTLILPPLQKAMSTLTFDSRQPWVVQEYIEGLTYCTYSVCHNGHITAHTTYPSHFTAGQGATIVFQHVEHPAISDWVWRFVRRNQFTGQISFEFIQTPQGQLYALKCDPRATGGVHLLASHPQFTEAFLNADMDRISPAHNRSHMLSIAMLLYGLPQALAKKGFSEWMITFFSSDDVILGRNDMKPFLLQWRSILAAWAVARREKISLLEASTFDIEWNGEK